MINFFSSLRLRSCMSDMVCIAIILLSALLVFGLGSHRLGFYADDASFLVNAPALGWSNLASEMFGYVTGRNLHMLWQFGIYQIFGYSLGDLGLQHWFQALFSGINAALLFIAIRLFGYKLLAAFLAAILFAFYPNHAEVQYWLSSLPMNLMSTFFVLIQIILSTIYVRSAKSQNSNYLYKILFLIFITYINALFTYDQVVPVVVTLALLLGSFSVFHKKTRTGGALYLLLSFGSFIGLLIWKISDPAGGPVLKNINFEHIWYNFNLSIRLMFGDYFQNSIRSLVEMVNFSQQIFAFIISLIGALSALILCWSQSYSEVKPEFSKKVEQAYIQLICFIFPFAFYLLAYLPVYIWYIAPRHNYLPTVGVAFGFAMVFSLLIWLARFVVGKRGELIVGSALIAACFLFVNEFIKADLVEKEAWTISYQARKNLYAELEAGGVLKNGLSLVIGGSPTVIPSSSAPLGYQPPSEVELITEGRIKIKNLDRNIQLSESGVYIYGSANEHGLNAFRHIDWADVLVLQYKKLDGEKMSYDFLNANSHKPAYSFKKLNSINPPELKKFSVRLEGESLRIGMPKLSLAKGETITLLPLITEQGKKAPLKTLSLHGMPLSFLVEIPPRLMGMNFELFLPAEVSKISDIQIYISYADKPSLLIGEVHLSQVNRNLANIVDLSPKNENSNHFRD